MLSAVLLHSQEPGGIVNVPFHRLSGVQRAVAGMHHLFSLLPGIQHPYPSQNAGIRRLAAALGIKGGGVQNHGIALFRFLAG